MDHVIIGVTHDHHSVRDYHRTWEFGKFSQTYYDFFVDSFVQAFEDCRETLTDVTVQYGQQEILGFIVIVIMLISHLIMRLVSLSLLRMAMQLQEL
ncbi:hypothetical protein S101520_02396 [Lactiplantibacillus plantarum subsp. plantarum]|nr:hypothetical protein S101520_02396 [Lactiplantibacillus plantarum subsp. plantarum]